MATLQSVAQGRSGMLSGQQVLMRAMKTSVDLIRGQQISNRGLVLASPGALSARTLGAWKKCRKLIFFMDGSLISPK